MSELSKQNLDLIQRLRRTLSISPNTAELLIAAWAQTNALLDAARAEAALARPKAGEVEAGAHVLVPMIQEHYFAENEAFVDRVRAKVATLNDGTALDPVWATIFALGVICPKAPAPKEPSHD